MENLKKLNKLRVIAQGVQNPNFKREYQNLITPILEKYQNRICSDDEMLFKINDAIKTLNRLAVSYQYFPNESATLRKQGTGSRSQEDFTDIGKLYELELLSKKMMNQRI